MIGKIRVYTTVGPDLKGLGVLSDISMLGIKKVKKVQAIKVYRLEGVSLKDTTVLAEKLFSESINQSYTIDKQIIPKNIPVVEIAYKPGVMNPEIASILKSAEDLAVELTACDSSWEYAFFGVNKKQAFDIVNKIKLYNPLIEHHIAKDPKTLIIEGKTGEIKTIKLRQMTDQDLLKLSQDKLFLNLGELKAIQKYFQKLGREPIDAELETLAQTWSEHSGHKTFKSELLVDGKKKAPLIQRIKKEALKHSKNIVSAFVDNSGVMDFYDGFAICGKVETHNSPSAIEPYGGAMTGSGGVFRDIAATGQGAKNIASTDIFCFAPLDLKDEDLPQGSLSPRYLLQRVVSGVKDYGNRLGIPTNNGSVHFHKDFRAKPSVIVGAYGIVPKKFALKGKPAIGDLIICIGGRTGRDGIHGATFSSAEMTEKTIEVNATAVQIGNAIEEKRILDALLEARDQGLIRVIQDVGGGGFSSAIGEIGEDLGVWVDIKNAPVKYQGLAPWEIWVSESQERMIVVVEPKNLNKFIKICEKYNVEYSKLGEFDSSKKLQIFYGKEKLCDLEMDFLHHGLPKRILVAKKSANVPLKLNPFLLEGGGMRRNENWWVNMFKKVLSHGNVCSKEPIVRLYDHSVGGTNDLQPYSGENLDGPNDSVVLRPFLNKKYGVVISHGLNPILNNIDPYWGSIWACSEALSNFVAVGGDWREACLINNYIWPFPDEQSLWSLDRSVTAVCDFMKIFKLPVISGKDSLSSTYKSSSGKVIKIPPILCMSIFGKIPNTSQTTTADFKKTDSIICLVGKMDNALGGSIYLQVIHPERAERVEGPKVDLKTLARVCQVINKVIKIGNVSSVHDVSEGGIISAVFEMCVGGGMGAVIDGLNSEELFNETAGIFVVEVENEKVAKKLFKNVPYKVIGKTIKANKMEIYRNKLKLFEANIDDLKQVWQKPMKEMFS
ncbi:phosphoribosylformylglycinamidine synthase subunit PurL [Candidatus Daviesbacteria bacterium]|nr:phosphoribosylformylglycinamidine synthase subunit PurL [Candidatus Daviesbacteria bacterium]